MLQFPQKQINMGIKKLVKSEDALLQVGKLCASIGKRAFIIGGPTALSITAEKIKCSMDEAGLIYHINEYRGFCSINRVQDFVGMAEHWQADMIVAIGGGAIMDTGKAIGYYAHLPVITIPTIAATCAAWAPVSVLYDDEHLPAGGMDTYAPEYVICDYNVLMNAPKRYIAAGLGDSLAKWPELGTAKDPGPSYSAGVALAKHLYYQCLNLADVFAFCDSTAANDIQLGENIVDNVIMVTGLSSELTSGAMVSSDYPLIAHGIDNALLRYSKNTHTFLHGERVSFGLVPHMLICSAPMDRISEVMQFLVKLKLPTRLEDFGIDESDIPGLSMMIFEAPGVGTTGVSVEQIERALYQARSLPWADLY